MESVMTYAQTFFGWLVQTTLIASVVICLILLIQKTLGGKLGPRWCHALWLVLLIRMILPWAPSSRVSLLNLIPSWDRQIQRAQSSEATELQGPSGAGQISETAEAIPAQKSEFDITVQERLIAEPKVVANIQIESQPRLVSLHRVLPVLWLAGSIVIGAYLLMSNFALWRIVKRDSPLVNQAMLELFEECKEQMGVQSLVTVVPSSQIKSPALFGFIRPRLLLPLEMLEKASREEMRYVFLHELAHLKRRDIYLGWLTSLLQVLHWFNPLVWFAFYRMRADRELACDALVLARTQKEESQEYGQAIVSLVRRFSRSRPLPAMAGIIENKSQLKRRITMITQFKKNSYHWSPLAVMLIVILACVSLPDAKRTKASETAASKSTPHVTLRQIWSGPDVDTYGTPSADGRHLSYVDWETGDLALRELATGKTRRLTEKGGWEPPRAFAVNSVISRDNKLVAYSWFNKHGTYDLCLIGVDGTGDRTLCSNKDYAVYPVSWSSDGKQIAARKYAKGGDFEIILVTVEDRSIQVLRTFTGSPFWARFSYSPDDQFVVYDFPVADDMSKYDISLLSIDGDDEIPLIKHPANDRLLGWVPNREEVLFLSDRAGTQDLWVIQVRNGRPQGSPRRIKSGMGQISPMGFTQNGSFYFNIRSRFFNTYIATSDLETGKILAPLSQPFTGSNFLPEWSPNGEYIAYVSEKINSAGGFDDILHIRNLKTGEDREVSCELNSFHNPRWSPDGHSILVTAYDRNNKQDEYNGGLYKIDVEDGNLTALVQYAAGTLGTGGWGRITGEWSPDGKAIFYINRESILMRQLESGREKQLYNDPNLQKFKLLALSPDGQKIVFGLDDPEKGSKRLMIMPASGGKPHELLKLEESGRIKAIAWTPDGKYVLFTKEEKKGTSLWRITPEGGYPQRLWESEKDLRGLRIHADRQQIAFYSLEKSGEVWVMENFLPEAAVAKPTSMTTVRRIGGDWGTFASLSLDGRYMCDVDWDTEALSVLELATGKVRHLTSKGSDDACYPLDSAISPDSKEVAYLWWDPNTRASSLHVVGLDGSGRRLLCKGKYPMPRSWSADGKKILAIVSENDVQQMVWVSASDGSMQHIASFNGESLGYPGKFDISPDGRFVAFDRPGTEDASKRDLVVFDLDKNVETSLVEHPADDRLLGWTPDGRHVLFASDRAGNWDAWLLQVADGRPQGFPKLTKHGIGDVRPIGFTPYGSYYYAYGRMLNDVFTARLDLDTGEVMSEPVPIRQTGATACHDWSPDGQYLAYCERRPDESQVIHVRTLATGRERTLAENLPYIRWLRWSPDRRSLLIDGYKRGDSQGVIFKINVQTGKRTELVRSETEVLIRPEMSPDGKTLFFDRNDPKSKTMRLMARDLESGREKELLRIDPPARLTGSALSPDGRQLVLSIVPSPTSADGPVLRTISTAGGQPRELLHFEKSEKVLVVGVTWMPDSRDVLFWKSFPGGKEQELWRISAEGGEPRRLWSRKTLGHMRVHPDGQRIAFYDRSTPHGVWVMENFLPEESGK